MVNLQKGETINLSKGNSGLSRLRVGLGWDVSRGILFNYDLDAGAILLRNGAFVHSDDLVYFGNKHHNSGAVWSTGDNLTGKGDGDDEVLMFELEKLPKDVTEVVIIVQIFLCRFKRQNFGKVNNSFMRIVDCNTGNELARFSLQKQFSKDTGMYFGKLVRTPSGWDFTAMGEGVKVGSISGMTKRYALNTVK